MSLCTDIVRISAGAWRRGGRSGPDRLDHRRHVLNLALDGIFGAVAAAAAAAAFHGVDGEALLEPRQQAAPPRVVGRVAVKEIVDEDGRGDDVSVIVARNQAKPGFPM